MISTPDSVADFRVHRPKTFNPQKLFKKVVTRACLSNSSLTFDPSIDFEGHSIHFALGEKLTDQLSFEWEVQSLHMDLDSFNPQSNDP